MDLGYKIKILRKKNNLNQSDLARKLGVSTAAVGFWETNKRQPDINILLKLSDIFVVSIDYLLNSSDKNKIAIMGRNGDYKTFYLKDKDLDAIKSLAESLSENIDKN